MPKENSFQLNKEKQKKSLYSSTSLLHSELVSALKEGLVPEGLHYQASVDFYTCDNERGPTTYRGCTIISTYKTSNCQSFTFEEDDGPESAVNVAHTIFQLAHT